MDFRQNDLRYFAAVVEDGQINKAASKLLIARSVLATAIEGLEGRLGVRLLRHREDGVELTPAGELFWQKAGPAARAELEATFLAEELAREAEGAIVIGHVGLPPWLAYPRLIESFSRAHPNVEVSLRELPFPWTPASAWLSEVDVTITTALTADAHVWALPIRRGPSVLLVGRQSALADHVEVAVHDVLDETFIAFEPWVDPTWTAFWSLDASRGGPATRGSDRCPTDVQGMLRMIAAGEGVITWPAEEGTMISKALPGVFAVPLRGAPQAVFSIVGHEDRFSTAVEWLVDAGRELAAEVGDIQLAE